MNQSVASDNLSIEDMKNFFEDEMKNIKKYFPNIEDDFYRQNIRKLKVTSSDAISDASYYDPSKNTIYLSETKIVGGLPEDLEPVNVLEYALANSLLDLMTTRYDETSQTYHKGLETKKDDKVVGKGINDGIKENILEVALRSSGLEEKLFEKNMVSIIKEIVGESLVLSSFANANITPIVNELGTHKELIVMLDNYRSNKANIALIQDHLLSLTKEKGYLDLTKIEKHLITDKNIENFIGIKKEECPGIENIKDRYQSLLNQNQKTL